MISNKILSRLEEILGPDLPRLIENSIVKNQNQYNMFNTWVIQPQSGTVHVIDPRNCTLEFGSLKSAMAWCIAKKYKNIKLADEITQLDLKESKLKTDIVITKQILSRVSDRERKTISQIKLEDTQLRLQFTQSQMEKCVNRAKYCQLRGFNDEIARTRRPASNRTTR
jgi:hypothetical protein